MTTAVEYAAMPTHRAPQNYMAPVLFGVLAWADAGLNFRAAISWVQAHRPRSTP